MATTSAHPSPSCLVCDGIADEPAFPFGTRWNGREFSYLRCRDCGTTRVHPLPSEGDLQAIYAWDNYHARHFEDGKRDYAESTAFLAAHRSSARSLLDFGCGDGGFLAAAREAGYDACGVEYEASAIELAGKRAGVPVTSLEALEASGRRFDVVHLSDVLPHLTEPLAVMRRLEEVLAPGGVLYIEGPLENNASLVAWIASAGKRARRRLGIDAIAGHPPTMLMRFTLDGQRRLFARLGYRALAFRIYETGWPYYLKGRAPRSAGEILKQLIGRAAIVVARAQPASLEWLGNRYRGIFVPTR